MNCIPQFNDYMVGSWTDASGFLTRADSGAKQILVRARNVAISVGGALAMATTLFAAPITSVAASWNSNANAAGKSLSAYDEHTTPHLDVVDAKSEVTRLHAMISGLRMQIRTGDRTNLDPDLLSLASEAHDATVARNGNLPSDWAKQLVNSHFS